MKKIISLSSILLIALSSILVQCKKNNLELNGTASTADFSFAIIPLQDTLPFAYIFLEFLGRNIPIENRRGKLCMESINFFIVSPCAIDAFPDRGTKDKRFCMPLYYHGIIHIFCKLSSSDYLFQSVGSAAIKE